MARLRLDELRAKRRDVQLAELLALDGERLLEVALRLPQRVAQLLAPVVVPAARGGAYAPAGWGITTCDGGVEAYV